MSEVKKSKVREDWVVNKHWQQNISQLIPINGCISDMP